TASSAQVQQEPSVETTEDTGIHINCSHPSIKTVDFIHWFRQFPGRGPERIEFIHKGTKELRDPPGLLSVSEDRRSSALWLSHPRLRDAAVYYCAV
ncbi:TVAZ2 protein, partial [Upupa epops]|nr:TVAZ2 protein [Upupa epops]